MKPFHALFIILLIYASVATSGVRADDVQLYPITSPDGKKWGAMGLYGLKGEVHLEGKIL